MSSAVILTSRRVMIACVLMAGLAAGTARAAEIYLTKDMPLNNTTPNSWATTGYWSDNNAAAAGNDYYVGRTGIARGIPSTMTGGTFTCRTPNNADATFPGDSLTIDTSGSLSFKGGGVKNYTFNDLRLTGRGQMGQGTDNTTAVINGLVTLAETPVMTATGTNTRNFLFNAPVQGSGVLTLNMDGNAHKTVVLTSDANTFSGSIIQNNGYIEIRSRKAIKTVHDISIRSGGKLQATVDVDARNTTLTLASGTQVDLIHNMQFGAVVVGGTKLASGAYSSAALQAQYAAYFTNGGGTLYIGVPGAFDVVQIATMAGGTNWTGTTFWSDGQGAHAGADYLVGRTRSGGLTPVGTAETICRTPDSGLEHTFPGDSLTLGSNCQLRIKAAAGAVINIADLTMTSGTLDNGTDNTSYTLRGHLLVQGNSRFRTYDTANRQLIIESQMEGPASANIQHLANTTGVKSVTLANNTNTYAGSISGDAGLLILGARSALGKARLVTLSGTSKLQSIVPVTSAPSTTLTLSGSSQLVLQNVMGFGNVIIGGKTLAPGKYKASALMTSFSANIVNSGGELQVGFDPSPVRGSWLFN